MQRVATGFDHVKMIEASWTRCRQQHQLVRDGSRPILRLQSSEVAPRLESLMDRTSGGQGIFRQLSESVASTGHCLVVTDDQGILVRLDSKFAHDDDHDWNGIALGSCWDERIAGTNGVSMALNEKRPVTVRGQDHFFSRLTHFACTAVPLLDAENQTIGVITVSAIDRGNINDYLFARQLLETAADRIQRHLFERRFDDGMIVSLSVPDNRYLFRSNEMIAVSDEGVIVGGTAKAHSLVGYSQSSELVGKSFELLFGADTAVVPERLVSLKTKQGTAVNLRLHFSHDESGRSYAVSRGALNKGAVIRDAGISGAVNKKETTLAQSGAAELKTQRRRMSPSLSELACGNEQMARQCNRANHYFHRAIPFVIEGQSGVGKTTLVTALHEAVMLSNSQVVTIDCASLGEDENDRLYFRTLIEQARAVDTLSFSELRPSTLVLDNIDELPVHAQAELRRLLNDIEVRRDAMKNRVGSDLRIIATCRTALIESVERGDFREDLYYLLASAVIELPSLAERGNSMALIQSLITRLSQIEVEVTAEAERALLCYGWPGNVRQLRSVISQALIEGNGKCISLVDLAATPVMKGKPGPDSPDTQAWAVGSKLYDEKQLLKDTLTRTDWNVSQAARELGIGRATMHRKMSRLGITRPG